MAPASPPPQVQQPSIAPTALPGPRPFFPHRPAAGSVVTNVEAAPNSVELTTNAKGKVQISVKVYSDDPAAAALQALAVLKSTREALGADAASG